MSARVEPCCPICRRPRVERFKPFCSKRCADIDLSRWLGGTYSVPATEDDTLRSGSADESEDFAE